MKTSREQFEVWYFKRYGDKDLTVVRNHAEFCDALEVWQASRQCIEAEVPGWFYYMHKDKCLDYQSVVDVLSLAGIKTKGA